LTAQQPIINALYTLLANNTTLTASVSSRIYDTMAPQDPTLPFVLVNVITDPVVGYFNAIDSVKMDFQVDTYGKLEGGNAATRAIADNVYAALHRQVGFTASGYTGLSIMCQDRGNGMDQDYVSAGRTQQDAWRVTQTYRLWATGS
jgi:hypothetical protein